MKAFHKQATQYWIRSSQLFHLNLVRSPALFLVSDADPVGSLASNMRVRDSWESLGVKVGIIHNKIENEIKKRQNVNF